MQRPVDELVMPVVMCLPSGHVTDADAARMVELTSARNVHDETDAVAILGAPVLDIPRHAGDEQEAQAADPPPLYLRRLVGPQDSLERVVGRRGVLVGQRDLAGVDLESHANRFVALLPVAVHDGIGEELLDEKGELLTGSGRNVRAGGGLGDERCHLGERGQSGGENSSARDRVRSCSSRWTAPRIHRWPHELL